jgi:Cof subfamily protein (haloacid dehalogenase superfamily)
MLRSRLLALDLDGTLLRRDGSVDPRDVAAIRRARDAGVRVTIATGRLVLGALPTARALDFEEPMICGDGATLASATTGEVIDGHPVDATTTEGLVRALLDHGLVPFVFHHGEIHADEAARRYHGWMKIWSETIHYHATFAEAAAWRADGHVAMTLGLGEDAAVDAAHASIEASFGPRLSHTRFGFAERHFLRSHRSECSKGAALARLSERLGIAREDCAVVGDWWNDVSMFGWAGRSFVMRGAPEEVCATASDRLRTPAGEGGGVAEAIDRWLATEAPARSD